MNPLTPEQIIVTPAGDLAELASTDLFELRRRASKILTAAKKLDEHLDRALELKYGNQAQKFRLARGKDTGVIHFHDGPVRVTADLPKKVEWDQKQLAEIVRRIREGGEDPGEYVEIDYRVSEAKFKAWPETLRSVFVPARTLKTGKPGFRLALVGEGGVS
ncbi:MAG: hypothetical protein ACREWE_12115 [Gammaproteobacteria bacterium]